MHNLIVSINPNAWLTAFIVFTITAGACFLVGVVVGLISLNCDFDERERERIRHFMRCMLTASVIVMPCGIFSVFAEYASEDHNKAQAATAAAYVELSQQQ